MYSGEKFLLTIEIILNGLNKKNTLAILTLLMKIQKSRPLMHLVFWK